MKKLFVISDLDGTLRDLSHRLHYVQNGNRDWGKFFGSCDQDEPIWDVINIFVSHINAGHRCEIWSGACESSREKSAIWLNKYLKDLIDWRVLDYPSDDVGQFLVRMRPQGDSIKDYTLKESWLLDEIQKGNRPDLVYDDRYSVIERCFRKNEITCAQVAPYFDEVPEMGERVKNKYIPRKPTLTVMIGPSGSGKDYWLQFNSPSANIISSDNIRYSQFPSEEKFCSDEAYEPKGFGATFSTIHKVIKSYLEGGIDVVYNATNIKAKNRKEMLKFVGADKGIYNVEYVLIDRPLDEKINSFKQRVAVDGDDQRTSEEIIRKHHASFQSSKKHALNGDGFDFINVRDFTNGYDPVKDIIG